MRFVFLWGLLLIPYLGSGQYTQVSRKEALADIDSLVRWIHLIHPGMYAICPEKTFQEKIASVKAQMPDTVDQLEFCRRVTPCVTLLGDGHTRLDFFNTVDLSDFPVCPAKVMIHTKDSTLYLQEDSAKIIAVNGIPARCLLENMLLYSAGESLSFRFQVIEMVYEILLPFLYPASRYQFSVLKNGVRSERYLDVILYKQMPVYKEEKKKNYEFRLFPEKKTLLFICRHFSNLSKFKVFADSLFRVVKEQKIKNLVIDIRDNGGGDSRIGDELLQYLSQVPFAQFGKGMMHFGPFPVNRSEKSKAPVDSIWQVEVTDLTLLREEPLRVSRKCKVYLLTSPYTFSSAASFSWAFKYFKAGKIVGEETGGQNVTFGDTETLTLPHTRLNFTVSWKKFYHYGAEDSDIHGTLPDIEVPAPQALDYTLNCLIR